MLCLSTLTTFITLFKRLNRLLLFYYFTRCALLDIACEQDVLRRAKALVSHPGVRVRVLWPLRCFKLALPLHLLVLLVRANPNTSLSAPLRASWAVTATFQSSRIRESGDGELSPGPETRNDALSTADQRGHRPLTTGCQNIRSMRLKLLTSRSHAPVQS